MKEEPKVGEYWKDSQDLEIVQIIEIENGDVVFHVISDPNDMWCGDAIAKYDLKWFKLKFHHYKVYNSPLYKAINS